MSAADDNIDVVKSFSANNHTQKKNKKLLLQKPPDFYFTTKFLKHIRHIIIITISMYIIIPSNPLLQNFLRFIITIRTPATDCFQFISDFLSYTRRWSFPSSYWRYRCCQCWYCCLSCEHCSYLPFSVFFQSLEFDR